MLIHVIYHQTLGLKVISFGQSMGLYNDDEFWLTGFPVSSNVAMGNPLQSGYFSMGKPSITKCRKTSIASFDCQRISKSWHNVILLRWLSCFSFSIEIIELVAQPPVKSVMLIADGLLLEPLINVWLGLVWTFHCIAHGIEGYALRMPQVKCITVNFPPKPW